MVERETGKQQSWVPDNSSPGNGGLPTPAFSRAGSAGMAPGGTFREVLFGARGGELFSNGEVFLSRCDFAATGDARTFPKKRLAGAKRRRFSVTSKCARALTAVSSTQSSWASGKVGRQGKARCTGSLDCRQVVQQIANARNRNPRSIQVFLTAEDGLIFHYQRHGQEEAKGAFQGPTNKAREAP